MNTSHATPKKKNEDSEFSLQTGFQRLLTEVNDLAGQHESISEKLSDEVAKNVLKLAHELRHERKTVGARSFLNQNNDDV